MVVYSKPPNNGFDLYQHHGEDINKTANKYLVFEILQQTSPSFSNSVLKAQGKIFNWECLPHVQFYIVIELSTNSGMVYHARSAGKVS